MNFVFSIDHEALQLQFGKPADGESILPGPGDPEWVDKTVEVPHLRGHLKDIHIPRLEVSDLNEGCELTDHPGHDQDVLLSLYHEMEETYREMEVRLAKIADAGRVLEEQRAETLAMWKLLMGQTYPKRRCQRKPSHTRRWGGDPMRLQRRVAFKSRE
jgi:hypothetical protein